MATWIEGIVRSSGVIGVALLMLLENLFPPIPSELIMPLAGYTAARGEASLVLVIFAGAIGSLAGGFFWYGLGRWVGEERFRRLSDRFGRWLTVKREDIARADLWFDRYGHLAVMFGRLIPTVRTLISIPAGLAAMPVGPFLLFSAIGTLAWTAALAIAGYALGSRYGAVNAWLDPLSFAVVAVIVAIYLYRVVTFRDGPS